MRRPRVRPAATARNPGRDCESAQTPQRARRWPAWSCANHAPTQPIPISVAAQSRRRGTPHARLRRARPHRQMGRSAAERRHRWVSPVPTMPLAQSLSPSCRRTRRSSRQCSRRRRRFRKERRTTGRSRRPSQQSSRWFDRYRRPQPARNHPGGRIATGVSKTTPTSSARSVHFSTSSRMRGSPCWT